MGGINSKRKFPFKRSKKKKEKSRQEQAVYMNEEPVYDEIGGAPELYERNLSNVSYISLPSQDSAFCERTSSLNRSDSRSTIVYDEPGPSLCSETNPKKFYQTYLINDDDGNDDTHTYISEVSLRETVSDGHSMKKYLKSVKKCRTSVSLEEVPYMVEAFQPLIEHTIDVMEVIPHMPYIDAHEFVYSDDPRKGVEMLIARIKSSDEPGKWQAFLHALNSAEYEYIVSLLRGETEEDHTVNRNLLKLFTPQIMNRIDPDEFIDHLFEKGVINERDMEEVRCEKDRRGGIAASFMLLHKVPRRVSNWFDVFLDVLEKCGLEDVIPQFTIPEVSVRPTEVKKPFTAGYDNQDYITPVFNDGRNHPRLPYHRPPAPLPLPVRIPPTFIHPLDQRQETRPKTELEILKEKKDSLQRRVEEKKLIRQYKPEVEALQKEWEKLNSDVEDSDVEATEETSLKQLTEDTLNGNGIPVIGTPEENGENGAIDFQENHTDVDRVNVDTKKELDNVNENHGQGNIEQIEHIQHISVLLTEMKQEMKEDILAMRDHVTDAVLKSVINLITGSAVVEDNPYMTSETGKTALPSTVQIYNSSYRLTRGLLSPAAHNTQRQYSVDSAIFSDGYVRSNI